MSPSESPADALDSEGVVEDGTVESLPRYAEGDNSLPKQQVSEASTAAVAPTTRVSNGTIFLIVAATFGGGMASIVPMAYTLSVKLDQLAPGRADLLGYLLGIGATITLIAAPLTGVLSDRTRSRWGRRRPFTVIGLVVGSASIPVMILAPDPLLLGVGWVLCTVGWGTAVGSVGNYQADFLAPEQRGKVSGFTGLVMQLAPVIGILLVGLVSGDVFWIFMIPSAFGLVLIGAFVLFAREPDSRGLVHKNRLTVLGVLRSYGFRPREFPDFAWNWLGRFVFFLGLTLTSSFGTFFYAQRLGVSVAEVAGFVGLTAVLSIGTSTLGALGFGALSDRMGRRRPFIMLGAAIFAVGAVMSAFASTFGLLIAGALLTSFGIAIFSAVAQALVLDVLPHRETQAGRFMAITAFSQKLPGAIAPLAAPLVLAIGGGNENYFALYLAAGVLALAGGATIMWRVRGVQ